MAAGWSNEATKVLLTIWGEQNIQNQIDDVVWNKVVNEFQLLSKNAVMNYHGSSAM